MFVRKSVEIIGDSGFNSKNRDHLVDSIVQRLHKRDFYIKEKSLNHIKFVRKQIGKDKPRDNLAIFSKIQYSGYFHFYFHDEIIKVKVKLNFIKQFILIFMTMGLVFSVLFLIEGRVPLFIFLITLIITFLWYEVSVAIGIGICHNILLKSKFK